MKSAENPPAVPCSVMGTIVLAGMARGRRQARGGASALVDGEGREVHDDTVDVQNTGHRH
jgi:hypothetical protein